MSGDPLSAPGLEVSDERENARFVGTFVTEDGETITGERAERLTDGLMTTLVDCTTRPDPQLDPLIGLTLSTGEVEVDLSIRVEGASEGRRAGETTE